MNSSNINLDRHEKLLSTFLGERMIFSFIFETRILTFPLWNKERCYTNIHLFAGKVMVGLSSHGFPWGEYKSRNATTEKKNIHMIELMRNFRRPKWDQLVQFSTLLSLNDSAASTLLDLGSILLNLCRELSFQSTKNMSRDKVA